MLQKLGHFTVLEGDINIRANTKIHAMIDEKVFSHLLFEVKCPKSSSKDDPFKLSIETRRILNQLVWHRESNTVVYSILVYSYISSIYKMALTRSGVYIMIKINPRFLPCCSKASM